MFISALWKGCRCISSRVDCKVIWPGMKCILTWVTCNMKAGPCISLNYPMVLMYMPVVFRFCHCTFNTVWVVKGRHPPLPFSIKQIKCIAIQTWMEVLTWITPWSGNTTNQGFLYALSLCSDVATRFYWSRQPTGKITRSTSCSALAEKKRFGGRVQPLSKTWLSMSILQSGTHCSHIHMVTRHWLTSWASPAAHLAATPVSLHPPLVRNFKDRRTQYLWTYIYFA